MTETPEQLRKSAEAFSMKAYREMKNHRGYATTPQAKIVLASLARAMFEIRQAEGRSDKEPSPWKEFFGVIEALSKAGCNILQARPSDPRTLPQVWRSPLNNEPLPPPRGIAERSLLQKLDPQLLQMFDQLEKEPYQTVHRMREDEAKREAMKAIDYGELAHESNPFRRGDQTEMARMFKHDPMLAQFCEAEARDVTLNLFGQGRDLTVRGRLIKDPAAGKIVELGEKIHEQWRLEDKAQASAAKAAAEQKLAELSASETPQPRHIARIGG